MESRKDSRPGLLPYTSRRKKQAVTRKASGGMSTMHPGKHIGLDGPVTAGVTDGKIIAPELRGQRGP